MVYLIGTGYMAREYAKILVSLKQEFIAVGRGLESSEKFKKEFGVKVEVGGVSKFLEKKPAIANYAIVCTPVDTLASVTLELLRYGFKNILVEKPGGISSDQLKELRSEADERSSKVLIGYNRRFYASTLELKKRLEEEELIAANFEITEWSNVIKNEPCTSEVKEKWIYANTSHVIDLVLNVTGPLKSFTAYTAGSLDWHSSASRFVGSGLTENDVVISYMGYWDGPGRWSAEFITKNNRYVFRPMEKLQVQKINSVSLDEVQDIDYSLEQEFKPGLYLQTTALLNNEYENFCTLEEQIINFDLYNTIAGYSK